MTTEIKKLVYEMEDFPSPDCSGVPAFLTVGNGGALLITWKDSNGNYGNVRVEPGKYALDGDVGIAYNCQMIPDAGMARDEQLTGFKIIRNWQTFSCSFKKSTLQPAMSAFGEKGEISLLEMVTALYNKFCS